MPKNLIFAVLIACGTLCVTSHRLYGNGYLGDCPGSTKLSIITRDSLKQLIIKVQGPGGIYRAKRTTYNYYQMDKLAKDPNIDFKKKTFVYVTAYMDSTILPLSWILGKIYFELGYNVLLVDTLVFTSRVYPVAARNVRPIGLHIAEMLSNLTSYGLDPKKLQLLGVSLAGQTISFAAKRYRDITGVNISHLVGLDPSGPCFRHLGPKDRLDASDADFVLSVTTNMDGMGSTYPMGHVSFYVNGGEYQPGEITWFPCLIYCSHARSAMLWIAALLNPRSFIGMQCDSVEQARNINCYERKPFVTNSMDLYTDQTKKGIFFLATDHFYPYFLGKKGLKRKYDPINLELMRLNKEDVLIN